MAAVSNMMPVSLPRFASASTAASTAKQKQSDASLPSQTWGESGGGDMLDFDMLAEYLLEDGSGATGLPAFDFRYVWCTDAPKLVLLILLIGLLWRKTRLARFSQHGNSTVHRPTTASWRGFS